MKNQILIFGSSGFLGSVLTEKLSSPFEVITLGRADLDLAKTDSIQKVDLKKYSGNYIVLCAAVTDVEKCFKDPVHSRQINILGMQALLQKIKEAELIPIFFSSDYVFSYSQIPLREEDKKSPVTVYGQQKLEIENFMKVNFQDYLIFRTSKLMSKTAHSKNILYPIVKNLMNSTAIRLFEDQWLNPVFAEDIAVVIEKSIKAKLSGEFHLGTQNVYTRAELGRKIADSLGLDGKLVHSGSMAQVSLSEPRPSHNVLDCKKIEEALNMTFNEVHDGIHKLAEACAVSK